MALKSYDPWVVPVGEVVSVPPSSYYSRALYLLASTRFVSEAA